MALILHTARQILVKFWTYPGNKAFIERLPRNKDSAPFSFAQLWFLSMTQSINTKQLKKPWVAIGGINAVGNRRAVGGWSGLSWKGDLQQSLSQGELLALSYKYRTRCLGKPLHPDFDTLLPRGSSWGYLGKLSSENQRIGKKLFMKDFSKNIAPWLCGWPVP